MPCPGVGTYWEDHGVSVAANATSAEMIWQKDIRDLTQAIKELTEELRKK
jgi:prefoldin subunit 5